MICIPCAHIKLSKLLLKSSSKKFHGSLRAPTPATASLHLFTAAAGHVSV